MKKSARFMSQAVIVCGAFVVDLMKARNVIIIGIVVSEQQIETLSSRVIDCDNERRYF